MCGLNSTSASYCSVIASLYSSHSSVIASLYSSHSPLLNALWFSLSVSPCTPWTVTCLNAHKWHRTHCFMPRHLLSNSAELFAQGIFIFKLVAESWFPLASSLGCSVERTGMPTVQLPGTEVRERDGNISKVNWITAKQEERNWREEEMETDTAMQECHIQNLVTIWLEYFLQKWTAEREICGALFSISSIQGFSTQLCTLSWKCCS
jgi:hypothetical protein